MAATVHHPKCQAVERNDPAYCNCGGSAFPVHEPDPVMEDFCRKLAALLNPKGAA